MNKNYYIPIFWVFTLAQITHCALQQEDIGQQTEKGWLQSLSPETRLTLSKMRWYVKGATYGTMATGAFVLTVSLVYKAANGDFLNEDFIVPFTAASTSLMGIHYWGKLTYGMLRKYVTGQSNIQLITDRVTQTISKQNSQEKSRETTPNNTISNFGPTLSETKGVNTSQSSVGSTDTTKKVSQRNDFDAILETFSEIPTKK